MAITRRDWFVKALALTAATAVAGVDVASAQTTLSVSVWSPPTSFVPPLIEDWGRQVTAATDGRVKLQILAKPVTNVPGHYDAVRNGLVDISYVILGSTPGRFVLPRVVELPFAGSSAERVSVAFQRAYDQSFRSAGEFRGVKVLAVFASGPGALYTRNKKVDALRDMEGLKFRVAAGTLNDIGKTMGVNVTIKPVNEIFELLSGGVLDGAFSTIEAAESFRLDRVAKNATVFSEGFSTTAWAMVMNEAAWEKLRPEDQAAVDKLAGDNLARIWGRAWDEADRRGMEFMRAGNVVVTTASAAFIAEIKAKTKGLDEAWIAEAHAKGVANAAEVLEDVRKASR